MATEKAAAPAGAAAQNNGRGATEREYVVLMQCVGGEAGDITDEHHVIVGRVKAATDVKAREAVGKTLPEDERDAPLVAIPARYWQPKARKVTTKVHESWG